MSYLKPMGKTQTEVLRCLHKHGWWSNGCGWIWGNASATTRILESLVKRGLATRTEEEATDVNNVVYKVAVYKPVRS